ncbi:MAG: divalent-cation tolerance protein CutA [Actinomycetales bacterium]|nr:divalent-cation tolerance protein CutA [Actinomycetales bacterium]
MSRVPEHCQVFTTTDSRTAADELARGAVEARLAACAQVTGPVTSSYWWDGAVQTAEEWLVVLKTASDRYAALEAHLRAHHGYEVPEILYVPVVAGHPGYLDWLTRETRPR